MNEEMVNEEKRTVEEVMAAGGEEPHRNGDEVVSVDAGREQIDAGPGSSDSADGGPANEVTEPEIVDVEVIDVEVIDVEVIDGEDVETDSAETDSAETDAAETEAVVETSEETIARLENELAETRAQADEAIDRMQRTAAEFQNARKRQERLLQDSLERATQRLLVALLPVQDDFALAFQNLPDTLTQEETAWVDGFKRIHGKLAGLLGDEGVTVVAEEGPFDPNHHEAVTNEPSDEVESGHIIAALRTGYILKDRVLRPALVRVAE